MALDDEEADDVLVCAGSCSCGSSAWRDSNCASSPPPILPSPPPLPPSPPPLLIPLRWPATVAPLVAPRKDGCCCSVSEPDRGDRAPVPEGLASCHDLALGSKGTALLVSGSGNSSDEWSKSLSWIPIFRDCELKDPTERRAPALA